MPRDDVINAGPLHVRLRLDDARPPRRPLHLRPGERRQYRSHLSSRLRGRGRHPRHRRRPRPPPLPQVDVPRRRPLGRPLRAPRRRLPGVDASPAAQPAPPRLPAGRLLR